MITIQVNGISRQINIEPDTRAGQANHVAQRWIPGPCCPMSVVAPRAIV